MLYLLFDHNFRPAKAPRWWCGNCVPHSVVGDCVSGSWCSVGAIIAANGIALPLRRGQADRRTYLPSANSRQLTRVCISICACVGACAALWIWTVKGQQLCRPWFPCVWPKLGGGLVWNVIYLQRASPSASACCVKTKIFIESPTLLRYLLTTSSSHCLVAVVLMRCFFSFLSSYLTSAGCNLSSDRSAIVPVLVFQVIFSSVFYALFDW